MTDMMLDRDGFRLRYRIDGAEGAPWLTLSNSLVCALEMWDGQMPFLAGRFRVLRYDTRGHGLSDPVDGPYTIEDLGGDVVALWDHLGIERSHFAGLSLGGMTGIQLALDHPERVASLTAADCRATADETYAGMFRGRIATASASGIEALVEPTLGRFFTPSFAESRPDVVEHYRTMIRGTSLAGHNGCCAALAGGDYFERLAAIRCPTLFLGGRHDIGAPPSLMQAMHEALPGSRHVVLEQAGHISCEEAPASFAAALIASTERQPAGRAAAGRQ